MATIDEHIEYLKDATRFPKLAKKPVYDPKYQLSSPEYNRIVDSIIQVNQESHEAKDIAKEALKTQAESLRQPVFLMTDTQYDVLEATGATFENGIYLTYEEERGQTGEVTYNPTTGRLAVGGSEYVPNNGLVKIPGATYENGYIKL